MHAPLLYLKWVLRWFIWVSDADPWFILHTMCTCMGMVAPAIAIADVTTIAS